MSFQSLPLLCNLSLLLYMLLENAPSERLAVKSHNWPGNILVAPSILVDLAYQLPAKTFLHIFLTVFSCAGAPPFRESRVGESVWIGCPSAYKVLSY